MPSAVRDDRDDAPLESPFVTAEEAARFLRVSRSKVYELLDEGVIESRRAGTRRLVLLASLHDFAARSPGPA